MTSNHEYSVPMCVMLTTNADGSYRVLSWQTFNEATGMWEDA